MGGYADEVSLKLTARDEMTAKLRQTRGELRKVEKEMSGVRKELTDTGSKEAAEQLRKLEKRWEELNDAQRDASKSLADARRAVKSLGSEAKDSARDAGRLADKSKDAAKAGGKLADGSHRASGRLASLARHLTNAAAKATHLDKRLDAAERSMSRTSGKWGKAGIAAGAAVAGGAAVAATAAYGAGKAIASMAQAAMEDEAGQAKLAGQLRATTKATDAQVSSLEGWISRQGELTGYADDEMRPALARLADSFGSISKAKDMTKLAMDIATAKGKDLATVSQALAKANDGQVGALKKLGITLGPQAANMNEYNIAQRAQLKLQAKAQDALDAYGPKSKQYAAAMAKVKDGQKGLNEIAAEGTDMFGELGDKFGGQTSAHAKTLEGRVKRLKLIFSETKESIGGAFIPVLTDLAGGFQDKALPVIRRMASVVMPKLRSAFDHFKGVVKQNRPGLEKMATIFGAIGKVLVEKVIPWLAKVQFGAWEQGVKIIAGFGDAVFAMAPDFLRFSATVVDSFNSVHDAALTAFGGILHTAEKTLGWIPGIGDKIRNASNGFDEFKARAKADMDKVSAGLRKAADRVDEWNAKARKAEAARIRGDIKDLTAKIAEGKKRLRDPKLTDPERTRIRADIADLRAKVADSKKRLDSLPSEKKITISAHGTSLSTEADKAAKLLGVLNKINGMKASYKVEGGYSGGAGGGDDSIVAPSRGGYMRPTAGGWSGSWARYKSGKYHGGADFGRLGNPVVASSDQRVRSVRHLAGSYGKHVIATNGRYDFVYAHMADTRVHPGQFVGRGQRIGTVGWTGHVVPKSPAGAHLHYEVRPAGAGHGSALNPARFMREGGRVHGAGSGTSDSVPIWASAGEFMIREAAARAIGYRNLEALNRADRMPSIPAPVVNVASPRSAPAQGVAPLVGTMVVTAASQVDLELGLAREARRQERQRRTRYAQVG